MILKPDELATKDVYKFSIGAVLPRPIAWVSTRDIAGNLNLAPYSFFTVASNNPFTLLFCPQDPKPGVSKDTLLNIEAVPEFVINITNEATAAAMSASAAGLPPGESEFDYAQVTPAASETISVPRVAEAPVAFECVLHDIVRVGSGAVVMGRVTAIHIDDAFYDDKGYVLWEKMGAIGRLAGNHYTRVTDHFEIGRR
ncbi:MAG: flavin reductase family protein [Candidatus Promineifilaceae bacterium]